MRESIKKQFRAKCPFVWKLKTTTAHRDASSLLARHTLPKIVSISIRLALVSAVAFACGLAAFSHHIITDLTMRMGNCAPRKDYCLTTGGGAHEIIGSNKT